MDLHGQRCISEAHQPLTWSDIDSYFRRVKQDPRPWEIDGVRRLDVLFRSCQDAKNDPPAAGAVALKNKIENG